jgi:dehydrogenase/reductase SDR family protein 7B
MAVTTSDEIVCPDHTQNAFRGKNVLLTGASGGLGYAFALQLAHCGVKTLVLTARSEASIQAVARECKEISSTTDVHCITCDLSNPDSVTLLGKEALKVCNDVVDMLINNGGVSSRSRFLDTKPEVDATVMQINFLSGASLAKAVVPGMVDRNSGAIIWISSVQGLFGLPERTSYAASKFAVQGYCEGLRGELASSGVEVHVASPGYIRTNLSRSAITGDGTPHGKLDSTTANGAS